MSTKDMEIVIVLPMPPSDAKLALKKWADANRELLASRPDIEIIVDVIRGEGGHSFNQIRIKIP